MKNFQETLEEENHPKDLSIALRSLWYLKKSDWDKAHDVLQEEDSKETAWVHGYLHKIEGDIGNAKYWYRQAGRRWREDIGLEEELEEMLGCFTETDCKS